MSAMPPGYFLVTFIAFVGIVPFLLICLGAPRK